MRKKLALLLGCVLSVSTLLSACGSNAQSAGSASASNVSAASGADTGLSEPGQFPLVKEKTTIKALIGWGTQTDINKNWNTLDYEEKTNVRVEWQVASAGDFREKRALVIASGDLPDVFLNGYNDFTAADEMQYGSQGSIIPLNDIIDKNSIYLKKIFDENPLYRKIATSPDGNIYSMPTFSVCYHCDYSQKMWVNVAWLNKLNMQMPTTTDEFEQMLAAFKEKDPNGNGKADEMPLMTTTDGWHYQLEGFLMNAFVHCDADTHLALNNGNIEMTAIKPEFKEGLKYLNNLYKKKLIPPQAFTTNATSMQKLNESGDAEVVGAIPGGANYIFAGGPAVSDRWRDYDILPPIAGPNGFKSAPNYSATRDIITGDVAISSAAKDPALIMRWIDWLYSEEGTLWHDTNGGREGTEYRKADAGEVGLDGNPAKWTSLKVRKPEDNVVWEQFFPSNMTKEFRAGWKSPREWNVPNDSQAPEVQLFQGTKAYEVVAPKNEDSLPNLFVTSDKISDYTRIKTGIDDYIKESVVKFITGNMDVEKDWDSYVEKMKKIGLDDYLKMAQDAYDAKFKN